jgi:hypothetical protein
MRGGEVTEAREGVQLTDEQRVDWLLLLCGLVPGILVRDYSARFPRRSASFTNLKRSLWSAIAAFALRSVSA